VEMNNGFTTVNIVYLIYSNTTNTNTVVLEVKHGKVLVQNNKWYKLHLSQYYKVKLIIHI